MPRTEEENKHYKREHQRNWRKKNPTYSSEYYKKNSQKRIEYANQYQETHPLRLKRYRWISKLRGYGLTVEDWDRLIIAHTGRCGICSEPFDESNLGTTMCIDHCHKTNRVRGLLCGKHNLALGKFGDNAEGLRQALRYLEES